MRLYLYLAGIVALLTFLGGSAAYFFYSQQRIERLVTEVANVSQQAQALAATNQALLDRMERVKAITDDTNQRLGEIRENQSELIQRMLKHDLGAASSAKPRLVEKTINKQSDDFFNSLKEPAPAKSGAAQSGGNGRNKAK